MAALGDVTVSIYQNWEYTYPNFREFHFKASTCREIVKAVVPSSVICIGKKLDGIQLFISRVCVCLVVSDSFVTAWTVAHGLLCRWNFPSKNTGVVSHFLLQGIFLTQGLNPCPLHLLHWLAGGFFTSGATLRSQSFLSLSRVRLCDLMDCSMPSFPVHHQLLGLAQTHVHRVGDAIQPSPLLLQPSVFPSIRVFSIESVLWHQVAKILEFQLQHQSFQWTFRTDLL